MTGLRIALLIGFLGSGATLACAEDLTISTYYPSPRGVYQELRTTNNTYLATQAGRVGIGTTDPQEKLHVAGGASDGHILLDNGGQIKWRNSAGEAREILSVDQYNQTIVTIASTGGALAVNNGANSATLFYVKDSNGYVGIGETTPGSKLSVKGGATIGASYSTTAAPSNGLIVEGNVGIGTSPAAGARLHITGSSNVVEGIRIQSTAAGAAQANYISFVDINGAPTGYVGHASAGSAAMMVHSYNGSVTLTAGGPGVAFGCTVQTAGPGWGCSSDARLKTEIEPISDALEKVKGLRGVSYRWRDPAKLGRQNLGVVAQEVEKVFPQVVGELQGYKTVDHGALIAPLIEAVKELDAENKALKTELETRIKRLEEKIGNR